MIRFIELGSGSSFTTDVIFIPPWLILLIKYRHLLHTTYNVYAAMSVFLQLGSDISSTPELIVIQPWMIFLKL